MDLGLAGRTALVTGSTAGIGLAIAQALAAEGAVVTINGRSPERVEGALAALRVAAPGATVRGRAADLATSAGADRIAAALPAVEILVNNLGIYEARPFTDLTDADWLRLFEINVLSGVRLSRHYLPGMLHAGWGRVIFISSGSALNISPDMIHYGMTKTAQVAVARGLAELTKRTGVTVNSVLAGPTRSEGMEAFFGPAAEARGSDRTAIERAFFRFVRPTSLLQRFAAPEEIASVVAFLASPCAAAINGAAVRADGGAVQAAL
jgi:NAD(P)-dependent dehydrogenase (short-subunit alcohol dehydrogenase family)